MFTVVALCAAIIAVAMYAENFIHTQRLLFNSEQRQVESKVIAANAKMRQTIARQELLGKHRLPSLVSEARLTGTVNPKMDVRGNPMAPQTISQTGITITTILTATDNAYALGNLRTQFHDVVLSTALSKSPKKQSAYLMFYDKQKTFLGLHSPQNIDINLPPRENPTDRTAAIVEAVEPIEVVLRTIPKEQLRGGKTIWIPPYIDKLTGTRVISRAAVVLHDDDIFSVIVISVPVNQFDDYFLVQPMTAGFAVIASNGTILSGKVAGDIAKKTLLRQNVQPPPEKYSNSLNTIFSGNITLIALSHPVRETGWTLLYTFDWAMLWSVLQGKILFTAGLALLLSLILWTVVILFNRVIFFPVFREALRVQDSEAFNRAMMGVAPLGFFVLNYRTGELLLDNVQARVVANQHCPSGDIEPLYQRLMTCYKNISEADNPQSPDIDESIVHVELKLPGTEGKFSYALAAFTRTRYLRNDVLLCCLSDITSQKYAERALVQAKIEADEANKEKSMFLALISHEIRTPLHGATGNLELLEMAALPPAERELVQTIRNSFQSLLRIINDILDISKIEAGQLSLDNAPFNIRETITQCTRLWMPAIEGKSIAFKCQIAPTVPDILIGDTGRIMQILNNLLSNAVKFTDRGWVALDVFGAAEAAGYALQIAIRDSGVGIAVQDQKRLFKPFSQANPSIAHEFGGTGLGLSLCEQLAEAMKGKITIQSEYGSGTIVQVKLLLAIHTTTGPLQSESNTPERTQRTDAACTALSSVTPPSASLQSNAINAPTSLRVLAVEDDPVCKKLLEKQMFALGYSNVDFVNNGTLALDRATSAPTGSEYDLIMTDMSLPLMSGDELILSLRRCGLSIPIIVITASVINERIANILPEIDILLNKPVSLINLKTALERYASSDIPVKKKSTLPAPLPDVEVSIAATNVNAIALQNATVDADIAMIFLDTYRDDLWALLHAFQASDIGTMGGRLHRLKGALLVVEEESLAQLAEQLCRHLQLKGSVPDEQQLRQFIKGLLQVVRNLRTALPYV
ncbi:ATP-binding protein [Glaciimonas sp. GG7]